MASRPPPPPPPDAAAQPLARARAREAERAEAELSGQEDHLADAAARAEREVVELNARARALREALGTCGMGAVDTAPLIARLNAVALVPLELGRHVEAALAAREAALTVRREALRAQADVLRLAAARQAELVRVVEYAEAQLRLSHEAAVRPAPGRTDSGEVRARAEAQARATESAVAREAHATEEAAAGGVHAAMPPPPGGERPLSDRTQPRVRMQTAIDLRSASNFFTGFSTNLSAGGVFVATPQVLPRGTPVDLAFSLEGRTLHAHGVVRWSRAVSSEAPELLPGLGVQFVDLPEAAAQDISRFVAQREPLFFPD